MSRSLVAALVAGLICVAIPNAGTRAWAQEDKSKDDKNKCTIAVKGDNQVVLACRQGGLKRAKAVMKAMQKLAKEKGLKFECDDCHKDEASGDWTITKDGEDKFKKMLEAVKET